MAEATHTVTCRLCGLVIRPDDHVFAVPEAEPPVVHVTCAEAAHLPPDTWNHADAQTLSQWSRGMGWASST